MLIEKILNNNVVLSTDLKLKKEVILMGCGIAFNKKVGEIVELEKIEKTFVVEDKKIGEKIKKFIGQIPNGAFQLAQEIILNSEKLLNKKLDNQIYISLADHIAFAIKRSKENIIVKNDLLYEIRSVHREEYKIGVWAVEHINKRAKINLPIDEAGFIALHLVNASYKYGVTEGQTITSIVGAILDIIKRYFKVEFSEEDLSYDRLLIHLKYFGKRILKNNIIKSEKNKFIELVKIKCSDAYECSMEIKKNIESNYKYQINDDEIVYLTMHIDRVIKDSKVNRKFKIVT